MRGGDQIVAKVLISPLFVRETPLSSPGPTFLLIGSGDSRAARAAAGSRRATPGVFTAPQEFCWTCGGAGLSFMIINKIPAA